MRVLMVYPRFPDTFWSFKHALRIARKKAAYPPLGLLTVAAMLPEDWQVRLVDTNVRRLRKADLRWADSVWIGGMIVQRDSARQIIARCKQQGLPVVAGGPLFTMEHEAFKEVDHFVLDEAEMTLPTFLEDWQAGKAKRIYRSEVKPDVTQSPTPRWSLAEMKHYASMSVQFSRGCPFDCDFCNVTSLFGRKPRTKEPEQMIAELEALSEAGWQGSIFFVDDNLIGNKKAAKELLPALIQWQSKQPYVPLQTEASINLADDPKLMQQMVRAGFNKVFVGIETPDDEALAECNKVQNRKRDLVQAVKTLHHAGLEVQAGFIVGFDNDNAGIFQRQIDFIQNSGIVTAMVGILQAPAGTRLYQRLTREGRILGESTGDNVDGSTNILTRLPADVLKSGYRQIMTHIYAPKVYLKRLKTFLMDYQPPKAATKIDFSQIRPFVRSLWRLGIFSKARWQYWQLMIWTAFKRRELFPLAVRLWIFGHHFRTVSQTRL